MREPMNNKAQLLDMSYDRSHRRLGMVVADGTVTASIGPGMELRFVIKELRDLADMLEDIAGGPSQSRRR